MKPQPLTVVERFVARAASPGREIEDRATQAVSGVVLPLSDTDGRSWLKISDDGL